MDKIGDLINRLATANPNSKEIIVQNSKYKREILKVLYEEGWIAGIQGVSPSGVSPSDKGKVNETIPALPIMPAGQKAEKQNFAYLSIFLKRPYIDASFLGDWKSLNVKVLRISKPGRRIYVNAKETKNLIQKITNLASTVVISTNQGVMTINKAVGLNLGGELLFKISL